MLTTILNNIPFPKCVVIQDTTQISGKKLLISMLQHHINLSRYPVHLFAIENVCNNMHTLTKKDNFSIHECLPDRIGWLPNLGTDFLKILRTKNIEGVIAIDSLAHLIYEYGIQETYELIQKLLENSNVMQIVFLIHTDMLEHNSRILEYLDYLSTLVISFIEVPGKNSRVQYKYKKYANKIIQQTEEIYFVNDTLHSKPLTNVVPTILLDKEMQLPENMSTFKISLDEDEKKSRAKLVLPYLKDVSSLQKEEGNVIYNLDDLDDWDEEDPDDDLDI